MGWDGWLLGGLVELGGGGRAGGWPEVVGGVGKRVLIDMRAAYYLQDLLSPST